MGKMIYLLMTLVAFQLALLVVFGADIPGSSVWNVVMDPSNSWANQNFINVLLDLALGISLGTILIGTFVYKIDFVVFAGFAGVLFSLGANLVLMFKVVCSHINPYINANAATTACTGNSPIITGIIIGPLILLYIFVTIEFWRGRD